MRVPVAVHRVGFSQSHYGGRRWQGRKVSCLVGHSLSVSHQPRVVEAAADPARGLQASPLISGPASLPHLLVRWELWLSSLRCDPRGGDPERRRPVC